MGLKLQYQNFPIAGRGGIVRFFMQIHDIDFEDEVVDMSADWKALKEELVSSGRNPCGTLPVVTDGEHDMSQHIAVTKYLARVYRVANGDPWEDYVQGLVADEYQGWRTKWVAAAWTVPQEVKDNYKAIEVPTMLGLFEALYVKYRTGPSSPYLSTSPNGKVHSHGSENDQGGVHGNVSDGERVSQPHFILEMLVPKNQFFAKRINLGLQFLLGLSTKGS